MSSPLHCSDGAGSNPAGHLQSGWTPFYRCQPHSIDSMSTLSQQASRNRFRQPGQRPDAHPRYKQRPDGILASLFGIRVPQCHGLCGPQGLQNGTRHQKQNPKGLRSPGPPKTNIPYRENPRKPPQQYSCTSKGKGSGFPC